MFKHAFARFFGIQEPSYESPGAGSGGGQGTGQSQSGGDGQRGSGGGSAGQSRDFSDGQRGQGRTGNDQQRGQGQGQDRSQGDGQRRGMRLAPDALVETEDGRVITYREYQNEERETISRDFQGRYKKGYDALVAEAQRLDKLSQQYGRSGEGQRAPVEDPLAAIGDADFVDGRTIKSLVKTLSDSGLAPIANIVKQQQQQIAQLMKELKGTGSHVQQFNEDRQSQQFQSTLTKTITDTEVKSFPGGRVDPNEPTIRELGEDLFMSYQPDSWRAGEFQKMLGDRLNALFNYFMKAQRDYANGAPERLKQHFNPRRGGTRAEGDRAYQFENPRQIVERARAGGMWGGGGRT